MKDEYLRSEIFRSILYPSASSLFTMRFLSCVSEAESTDAAVAEVIDRAQTGGIQADVLLVFFTAHHRD